MKRNIFKALAVVAALALSSCSMFNTVEKDDDGTESKETYITIGLNQAARTALPTVSNENDFTSFTLKGTTTQENAVAVPETTWTGDDTATAYAKMTAAKLAVTSGAAYTFTLTAAKGGATWQGTATKTIETGENSLSFTLSLAGLASTGEGSLSITLSVPSSVQAVEATLKSMDESQTVTPTDAALTFADGKAAYTASDIAAGNYVLVYTLYGDTEKTLKLGEWREYAGITGGVTSYSNPVIADNDELANIYTITLDTNGGTLNGTYPGSYTRYSEEITIPVEANITRTGYTFTGWYDAETGGNKVESIAQGSSGAKIFYARWSLVTYTITYNMPDGTDNPNTATSYTIESETITLQKPTKEGYTFAWKNGTEEVTQISKGSTGDITLTGTFTPISYSITYEGLNGATNSNPVTYTIETDTITLQDASREDYNFEGWYDAETGGNKVTSIQKGSTGAKTLYAQLVWKWIGSKSPTTSKTVGDIVFNDGSATPYSNGMTITNEQKAAAIALIFYKGTGLNSGSDTTTRTLGVGLKHNKDKLAWCTESAKAYNINITTIQCPRDGSSFTGDKNGSDNLAQISEFLGNEDDTATAENYPAFYWCINYSNYATNLGTDYQTGWYLPTHAELYQIYNNKTTIDTASVALGGNKFETDSNYTYTTSTQHYDSSYPYGKINLNFKNGNWSWVSKKTEYAVCAIREF